MRWMSLETCRGELYWMTQSRNPMSMPSSRLLVQMTPESFPSLRLLSVASLVALERELWWIPIGSFSFQTLNLFASASASDLVFVNISVDLYFSTDVPDRPEPGGDLGEREDALGERVVLGRRLRPDHRELEHLLHGDPDYLALPRPRRRGTWLSSRASLSWPRAR